MKKTLVLLCAAAALAACEKKEQPLAVASLQCGEYAIETSVFKDRVDVVIGEEKASLAQAESADGAKYEGAFAEKTLVLWNKGEAWVLIENNGDAVECAEIAAAAAETAPIAE